MLTKERIYNNGYRTIDTYIVSGITNETNQELIDFCDRNCFCGRVYRDNDGTTAKVECDID